MSPDCESLKLQPLTVQRAHQARYTPPVLHQNRTLGEVLTVIAESPCIFTMDDSGKICGLVAVSDILTRMGASNSREKARWLETPLSALSRLSLLTTDDGSGSTTLGPDCTAVIDRGNLMSLVTQNDVLISWRYLERLFTEATTDPLTGLVNRLGYDRRLQSEWDRAARLGISIAVILVDLDDFKRINDLYGHSAGDSLLRSVGSALEQSVRSYDIIARYGGDEFIALCLGCRPGEIEIPIHRILTQLEEISLVFDGCVERVSASIGAAVRHDNFQSDSPTALVAAADECLYRTKNGDVRAHYLELGETVSSRSGSTFRSIAHTSSMTSNSNI